MKFRDVLNLTINHSNNQISLNVRKGKLKKANMDIDDILECDLPIINKIKEYD